MNVRKSVHRGLIASGLLLAGFLSSGGALAQESTPTDQQGFPVSIRFLNAMTSIDNVDVYLNGDESEQRVFEGLEYGVLSEAIEGTAPATTVLIKQNKEFGIDQYVYDVIVPTEAGKEYLIVISDVLIIPTEIDQSPLLVADTARARVIHAAAQAPALDIFAPQAGGDLALGDLRPVVTNVGYGQVTDGGVLPSGSYDVRAVAAGTHDLAVESSAMDLEAGNVYVLVVIGTPGDADTPLTLVLVSVTAN